MKQYRAAIEKSGENDPINTEDSREEKWVIRLFAFLLVCMAVAFIIHAIGQAVLIAHICA